MKKTLFISLASLILIPQLALAVPTGIYANIQAGLNTVYVRNAFVNPPTGFVGGAAVGYLFGNNSFNYGIEADALSYPDSNSSKKLPGTTQDLQVQIDGYNISLLGILKYTLSSGFTAFVKGGAAYVNQQASSRVVGQFDTTVNAEDTIAPEAAVGIGYLFKNNLEVDATFDRVFADELTVEDSLNQHINVITNDNYLLGLTYHFA